MLTHADARRTTYGFIDSHVHLADAAFDSDREAVIQRARHSGACALVCIGESLAAADRARRVAVDHPGFVYYTAGVHPHDAAGFDAARDTETLRSAMHGSAVAVGECGLDYHYTHSPRDAQLRAFRAQIGVAAETGKPLVVHTREAVDDTRTLVTEAGESGVRGVLHCFTGPPELAETALRAGWYLSFSGVVTFTRWSDDGLVRAIPADRLLVESDAPYLAPVPHRGKRNEPAWTSFTLARLAIARATTAEELGRQTSENTARLFGLNLAPH